MSPSLRGRGLKSVSNSRNLRGVSVALFTRAWIEIPFFSSSDFLKCVALFTRAWIEILTLPKGEFVSCVALFTRAWIEIIKMMIPVNG